MYKIFVKIISLKRNTVTKNLDVNWNKIPENKFFCTKYKYNNSLHNKTR